MIFWFCITRRSAAVGPLAADSDFNPVYWIDPYTFRPELITDTFSFFHRADGQRVHLIIYREIDLRTRFIFLYSFKRSVQKRQTM